MAYWNWGVHFNNHSVSHYTFMLNNEILVGSHPAVDYQIGDLVGIHKGQGLLAIAEVTGGQLAMPPIWNNGTDLHAEYGICQTLDPYYVPANFKKVFPMMKGAAEIRNVIRQNMIQALWNIL